MNRLQAASDAVKREHQAIWLRQDHNETVVVKEKMVRGTAQIIAAQEEMLCKEQELEEVQKKLAIIQQQQYKFLPTELWDKEQN
ncbi:hypothetical protein AV530_018220 [Patagioenas fasciata monilis]|uniref:Uncharacterized protein n=1 Tax=Patagioenas fasciata monilis TaxID=372326 RepID=A0A1V4J7G2_PATFA|nr:hypothetical protein AV530_018220 [Patagioenas fasciata monilis]